MRISATSLCAAAVAAAVLAALSTSATAEQPTLPQRKAGLWDIKTTMDEGGGAREQSMKMCVDAGMERTTVAAALQEHKTSCTLYDIKRDAAATLVEADCIFNKRRVTSTTRMSGDFAKAFEVRIDSTTTSAEAVAEKAQQSIVVKRVITQLGTYVGADCGNLKGGQAVGADGKILDVQ